MLITFNVVYIKPAKIIGEVCVKRGILLKDFFKGTRNSEVVAARKEVVVRLKDEQGLTFSYIGRLLKYKDHTSVMYHYYKGKKIITK